MANPEHLAILRQGVKVWNAWQEQNLRFEPEIAGGEIRFVKRLWSTIPAAQLGAADPRTSDLSMADLRGADLRGVNLHMASLSGVDLRGADLRGTNLHMVILNLANLRGANLRGVDLNAADLSGSDLARADLSEGELRFANFCGANLREANLSGVNIYATNFDGAQFGRTTLADVNLSVAKGLETVEHRAPSSIGIDTIYESHGQIPDEFLRDAGVPDEIIDVARSIRNGPPIQWHSCFISYSHNDEDFARRLHGQMRQAGMRVWYAPEDMKGGKKLHEQLFEAIQIHDRLLLVLSEHSIKSEWVMTEIRKAREVEKRENRRKLFPIRLVVFETLRNWTCFDADTGKDLAVEVREYFIPDFSNWKDHDSFEAAFAKLQKDLKTETAKP
jgi:uncharacterized protein YjbI with pentapeptide repeats